MPTKNFAKNSNLHHSGKLTACYFNPISQYVVNARKRQRWNAVPYPYLFHTEMPVFYKKGLGLFEYDYKAGEDKMLLNEYQFRLYLKHAPMRRALLKKHKFVYKSEAVNAYNSLSIETVKHLNTENRKKNPEIIIPA